jgi:hypothetical protein
MTIFLTILAGVSTFVFGQIVLKLLIDPVQEFNRVVAEIAHALIEHANVFGNPGLLGPEKEKMVSEELRKLSSRLNAQMYLIPAYRVVSKLFWLPSKEKVVTAAGHLIGLSNGFGGNNPDRDMRNVFRAQHIRDALGIYVSATERLDPKLEKEFYKG